MGPRRDGEKAVRAKKEKAEEARYYGECMKNHAAGIGRYAVDGCREFMADGEEGTVAALRCAACGCHRSFHRSEVVDDCSSNSGSPIRR